MKFNQLALGVCLATIASSVAQAAVITQTISFTFENFTTSSSPFGPTPPAADHDPVAGSVTVSYDNATDVSGLVVESISYDRNIFSRHDVYLNYARVETAGYFTLDIYHEPDASNAFDPYDVELYEDDYLLRLTGYLSDGHVIGGQMLYSQSNGYLYSTTQATLDSTISSVPVPAAFWLFGSGLLGLVGVARYKTIGSQI